MLFASAVVVAVPFALSDVVMVTTGLQNSGYSGKDTEEEINRRTQVTAQVVISGEAGQTIILSPDLFALTFPEETEPAAIHYTVTSSSAAVTISHQDSTTPLSTFSHQDLLDGAVVVTITDPSVLVDLNLTVRHDAGGDDHDGAASEIDVRVEFIKPSSDQQAAPDPVEAHSLADEPVPSSEAQNTAAEDDPPPPTIVYNQRASDQIDLEEDETEEVVYSFSGGENFGAADGHDHIKDFTPGQDVFSLAPREKDENLKTLADLFEKITGDPDTMADDQIIVGVNFGPDSEGNYAVTGVTLNFREGWVHDGGLISLPLVTISFDAPLSLTDFVTKIGGIENFDLRSLTLKKISLLPELLGGADHLKFLEETPVPPPPSPPTAMTLSADSQTVDEDSDAVKLADITFIHASGAGAGADHLPFAVAGLDGAAGHG